MFPNAPVRPIACNGGMRMPGWYDITALGTGIASVQDKAGILCSRDELEKFVDAERTERGILPSRIVIGGFSQGGAIAVATAVSSSAEASVAGVVCCSGYLPIHTEMVKCLQGRCTTADAPPIMMYHGARDDLVPLSLAQKSVEILRGAGWPNVVLKSYPIKHEVSPEEQRDVCSFIKSALPPVNQ